MINLSFALYADFVAMAQSLNLDSHVFYQTVASAGHFSILAINKDANVWLYYRNDQQPVPTTISTDFPRAAVALTLLPFAPAPSGTVL
jgi:hypothetical protein